MNTSKQGIAATVAAPKVEDLFKASRFIGKDPDGCNVTLNVEIKKHTGEPWKKSIDLQPAPAHLVLSMQGSGRRPNAKDIDYGGQCQDSIRDMLPRFKSLAMPKDLIIEALDIWDRWHLNDMKAASNRQSAHLKRFEDHVGPVRWEEMKRAAGDWYSLCKLILEKAGLLEDRGYIFGHAWLVEEMPRGIMERVRDVFTTAPAPDPKPAKNKPRPPKKQGVWFVTMTDSFMSGWGKAEGKNNKLVFECATLQEAEIVADNARSRTDQKRVSIRSTKPYYNQKTNLVQYQTKEIYPNWYIVNYFRNRKAGS